MITNEKILLKQRVARVGFSNLLLKCDFLCSGLEEDARDPLERVLGLRVSVLVGMQRNRQLLVDSPGVFHSHPPDVPLQTLLSRAQDLVHDESVLKRARLRGVELRVVEFGSANLRFCVDRAEKVLNAKQLAFAAQGRTVLEGSLEVQSLLCIGEELFLLALHARLVCRLFLAALLLLPLLLVLLALCAPAAL